MTAHALPMVLLLVFLSDIFRALGQPEAICKHVGPYSLGLLAALPSEIGYRYAPAVHATLLSLPP